MSALAILIGGCGGAQPQDDTITMIDMEPEVVVARRPPPFPAVAEPLGLAPPPPALPPFAARAGYPSDALIAAWHAALRTPIDHPPPDPPASASMEEVQRWARRDFAAWITARREALTRAEQQLNALSEGPPHERGIAAALVARLYDDFLYALTGAVTVPEEIARDPELLRVYAEAVHNAAAPLIDRVVDISEYCARTLGEAPNGWWTPWGEQCAERGALLARAPRMVAVAVIAERLASWPAPPPLPAVEPAPLLEAPRPRAIPRPLRDDITAFDALVRGQLAIAAGTDANEHWTAFATRVRREGADYAELATPLAELANLVAPASAEDASSPGELADAVPNDQLAAWSAAMPITDRARRCWSARSFALGVLAGDHADVRDEDVRARRRQARARQRFEERQRARVEAARALATLDGDALIQAALPLTFADAELADAPVEQLRTALRAYTSADGEGDPAAVRAAGEAIASAPLPAFSAPDEGHAARLTAIRTIYDALGQSPDRGARAIAPALAEDGPLAESRAELATWRALAEACR